VEGYGIRAINWFCNLGNSGAQCGLRPTLRQARELLAPVQLVRAMSIFHKTNATGLTQWLCVTTLPLFATFLCIARAAAASLGGMPCGVEDRVRKRQEGFFAANQCRRLWNYWPFVAALLLVLPSVEERSGPSIRRSKPRRRAAADGARSTLLGAGSMPAQIAN
jgi:hypothetical protein